MANTVRKIGDTEVYGVGFGAMLLGGTVYTGSKLDTEEDKMKVGWLKTTSNKLLVRPTRIHIIFMSSSSTPSTNLAATSGTLRIFTPIARMSWEGGTLIATIYPSWCSA